MKASLLPAKRGEDAGRQMRGITFGQAFLLSPGCMTGYVLSKETLPMTSTVVLVGCGNMGYAMLGGWLRSGRLAPRDVWVVEPNPALRERAAALDVQAVDESAALPPDLRPALIVLAVKPQVMR